MDANDLRTVLAFCARIQTIVWVIWAGVGALTIATAILMWTRWGKTRLTHKCVVLSVFAHLLLFTYAGTAKIIGAPGPAGTEGAPGIEGEHPTLHVTNVHALEPPDNDKPVESAAIRPWHVTPLRSPTPSPVAGPQRTQVDLSAELQRSASEPDGSGLERPGDSAEPLTPRSFQPRTMEAQPADHPSPAATPETIRPPPPAKQPQGRIVPPAPPEMQREHPADGVQPLRRQVPDASELSQPPTQRAIDEQRPISASDRSLTHKARAPGVAEDRTPAAGDAANDRRDPAAVTARQATRSADADRPPGLRADANTQRPQPVSEPGPTTGVESVPQRPHEVPQTYGNRLRADRANIVRKQGGSPDTEAAVKNALAWLAANQEPGGHWDAAKHGAEWSRTKSGRDVQGAMQPDTGVTGLALLAFLGAGHTHQGEQYRDTVRLGLDYLVRVQASDGNLSGNATTYAAMYCHGMATLAMAEAYGMTGDAKLRAPLRRAVAYTIAAQSPQHGGWRYRPNDGWGDTSQFGWQVMALKAAEAAGIELPVANRHGMLRFLEIVSSGRHGGLACYLCRVQDDGERILDGSSATMTAEALFCRFLLGTTPDNPLCEEASSYLLQSLPGEGRPDLYYWYYGTLAMYQLQGPAWDTWNRAAQRRILELQERNGSWGIHDRWGGHGGRVFTTALATLTLEVYYRYTPAKRAGR